MSEEDCDLFRLPDEVLYHVCEFINCPFDLLNFGSTCKRLRKLSLTENLWWSISFHWFKGLWCLLDPASDSDLQPRDWLLEMMRELSSQSARTKQQCQFPEGEKWQRIDMERFRFLFSVLRKAYYKPQDYHPFILHDDWLYDIGLYKRIEPCIDFSQAEFDLSDDMIYELTALGQASERDLRRLKQPFKNPKYYIKLMSSSQNWVSDLFSNNIRGTSCPLLMSTSSDFSSSESTGIEGFNICISVVIEKYLRVVHNPSTMHLSEVSECIKNFIEGFVFIFQDKISWIEDKLERPLLKDAVVIMLEDRIFHTEELKSTLKPYLEDKFESIINDITHFFKTFESIDSVVEEIRTTIRKAMIYEIERVLFPSGDKSLVTRINLTDSDLIGGDNSLQEMAAAAFISKMGVLVIWHLTGKMRH